MLVPYFLFFFFNDTATTEIYTLSLHDALPISYRNVGHSGWAAMSGATAWGVDQLRVQKTSSGELIRFSYRVVDAKKAQVLHDKKAEPHLIGLRSHAMLSVPTLENVGQLRQTEALENGKDRSEEHTSELQSPCNIVCRLLLE